MSRSRTSSWAVTSASLLLAIGSAASAQSAAPSAAAPGGSPGPAQSALPAGTPADDPYADLWLLNGTNVVTRLDGMTGEIRAQVDVTTEGCYWERVVPSARGGFWVMDHGIAGRAEDPGGPAVEAEHFCFAWFPLDGSEPQVHWVEIGDSVSMDTGGTGEWDGALWAVAAHDGVALDLLRLDTSAGGGPMGLSPISALVKAAAVQGDQLLMVTDPKNDDKGVPATLEPGSDRPAKLDIGLKRKEVVSDVEAGADGLTLYWDFGTFFVHDPTTGKLTRLKSQGADARGVLLTKEGIWGAFGPRPGLYLMSLGGKGKPQAVVECACEAPQVVGTTPGAVWWLRYDVVEGGWVLQRVDAATLQPTVDLDAGDLLRTG